MRSYALLALAASARLAAAHSTVYAIFVNDVDQGLGNSAAGYIRSPPNNDPLKDVTSASMTCNVNNVATAKTVEVKSGDKVTFEWHHNSRDASDDIIDPSHKGPVLTYIAPTKSNGAGEVWVKLAEDGYSASTGKWAVDTLIANKGKHSITIPDLAAGEYLLRPEIIALHEADRASGAQFYMECVQIKVTSAGAKTLPAGVAIPGTYTATDPGILFNLYSGSITSYTIPGPAVWNGASGAAAPVASSAAAVSSKAAVTSAAVVSSKAAVTSAAAAVTSAPVVVATSAPVVVATSAAPVVSSAKPVTSAPVVKTTLVTLVRSSTKVATVVPSATAAAGTGGTVGKYMQCGGAVYTGATVCESGWTCKVQNPYYSQCVSA